jgi:competence protein ComEA
MLKKFLIALSIFAASVNVAFAAVDINKATQAELDSVKGIGPSISKAILDERAKGAFKDWDDMVTRVKGIGAGNAANMSEAGLTIGGKSYTGAPAKAEPAAKKEAKTKVKEEKAAKEAKAKEEANTEKATKDKEAKKEEKKS